MQYISTRGSAPALDFEGVTLAGLAADGGLYVPEHWPQLSRDKIASFAGKPYQHIACEVMKPFVTPTLDEAALRQLIDHAYERFVHQAVTPLVQLDHNLWILELFHGPTLAFKDVALQFLGHLYDELLERANQRVTLIGATSGDTGGAAIEAIRGRERADIFIMHPKGRTSEFQRRQMTCVEDANVHNIAVEGTFDDCQAILKAMFNDAQFRKQVSMSGVNSINWARVLPQVVYYFASAVALGAPERKVAFCVPTGNFGDVFAGYVAMQMGLPVEKLIVATNVNDILSRVLATGDHTAGEVHPTMSPSMDIQVSSNFERLLFDAYNRDGNAVLDLMEQFKDKRTFKVVPAALSVIQKHFKAYRVDEAETLAVMREIHAKAGYTLDPHTAVGVGAALQARAELDAAVPMVVLATAHPAKFPDAVEKATGNRPAPPAHLADIYERKERYDTLPNDLAAVQAHVKTTLGIG